MRSGNEFVVEATLELISNAIRRVLGNCSQDVGDGEIIFTGVREVCPPIIKVRSIGGGRYVIISTSKCSVKDCSYWERCVKLDVERLEALRRELLKLADETKKQALRWPIETEGVSEKIIEKAYERMR
jgi:hypothetical protein